MWLNGPLLVTHLLACEHLCSCALCCDIQVPQMGNVSMSYCTQQGQHLIYICKISVPAVSEHYRLCDVNSEVDS